MHCNLFQFDSGAKCCGHYIDYRLDIICSLISLDYLSTYIHGIYSKEY